MNIQPLNINFFNNQKSFSPRISFGETPLYNINLKQKNKDGEYNLTPAYFSKIDNKDEDDVVLMKKIGSYWSRKPIETSYGITVSNNFLWSACDNNFYIIEKSDKSKNTYRKTTCIMETTPVDSLYGVVKEAQKHGFESVQLLSANNSFYEHMGFTLMENYRQNWYELPSSKFDKFLKKIEKKYGINKE